MLSMMIKCLLLCLLALLMCSGGEAAARQYQFIPARCVEQPGVEHQIGGPLSLCAFPPQYKGADQEDIRAVLKHIQTLQLHRI